MSAEKKKKLVTVDVTKYFESVLDCLEDMVNQHCSVDEDNKEVTLNSMCLTANAEAMRLLARYGRIIITKEYGRAIIAKYPDKKGE